MSALAGEPVDWHAAWVSALDHLDLEVNLAESLLYSPDPLALAPESLLPWSPPVLPVPLPADLIDRARGVLDRQLSVSGRLAAGITSNRRQSLLADRLGGYERERPVFLDQAF